MPCSGERESKRTGQCHLYPKLVRLVRRKVWGLHWNYCIGTDVCLSYGICDFWQHTRPLPTCFPVHSFEKRSLGYCQRGGAEMEICLFAISCPSLHFSPSSSQSWTLLQILHHQAMSQGIHYPVTTLLLTSSKYRLQTRTTHVPTWPAA